MLKNIILIVLFLIKNETNSFTSSFRLCKLLKRRISSVIIETKIHNSLITLYSTNIGSSEIIKPYNRPNNTNKPQRFIHPQVLICNASK